jgi:hypothetical protein
MIGMNRYTGERLAGADHLGQSIDDILGTPVGRLADELCITVRALNKINAERGASDVDIVAAARGLEERAERFLTHAQKLRAVVPPAVSDDMILKPLGLATIVLAHCDHVERFAYERQGNGLDALPHMLASAARKLAAAILLGSTNSVASTAPAKALG